MRFRAEVRATGKNTTGIPVTPEIVEALGRGKRPPVRITINGYSYRNTVASMNGEYMLSVSKEVREKAGISAGEEVDVVLELDDAPRTVEVPPDLDEALRGVADARAFFAGLSYSKQRWFVDWIEQARKAEIRQGRVEKAVEMLKEGRSR